jgi:hypothetical protein
MKTLISTVTLFTLMSLGLTERAQADSDGYFCVGPDYLAYEFSLSLRSSTHYLYVLSLGGSSDIGQPAVMALPRFQVHGMRCRPQDLQLLGWDSVYTVSLTRSTQPVLQGSAPWQPAGTVPPDFTAGNLGAWSAPVRAWHSDTVRLALASPTARYILAIDVHLDPKNGCQFLVRTKVVHLDVQDRPVQSRSIFEGTAPRECGE